MNRIFLLGLAGLLWSVPSLLAQKAPLRQNLTGYTPPVGELFYTTSQFHIDGFRRNSQSTLLYAFSEGALILLDTTGVEVGRKKLKMPKSRRYDRGTFFQLNIYDDTSQPNTFIIERNDPDNKANRRYRVSMSEDHKLKVESSTIGKHRIRSKSVFVEDVEFSAIELMNNELLLTRQEGTQIDTLYRTQPLKNGYVMGHGNITMQLAGDKLYVLDAAHKKLMIYNTNSGKLLEKMMGFELAKVFENTGPAFFRSVKLMKDTKAEKLYIVSTLVKGKHKQVIYEVTEEGLRPLELPDYDHNRLQLYFIKQIYDGHVYLSAKVIFEEDWQILKVALDTFKAG